MSYKKAQIQKKLHRKCPECGGNLNIVSYTTEKKGFAYIEQFIECETCDYLKDTGAKNKLKMIDNMD